MRTLPEDVPTARAEPVGDQVSDVMGEGEGDDGGGRVARRAQERRWIAMVSPSRARARRCMRGQRARWRTAIEGTRSWRMVGTVKEGSAAVMTEW